MSVAELSYESAPSPRWEPGWLLVRVRAVGVDPSELSWPSTWSTSRGLPRCPSTPGRDLSGVVIQGDDGARSMVGAEVFGIVDWWHDGAAADLVLVRPDHIVQKPEGLTHAQAASLPTAGMVALRTLDMLGASSHRRRLVVDGHPDPVVMLAIQLARRQGIDVMATGTNADAEYLMYYGVNDVVEHSRKSVLAAARRADLVLTTRGTQYAEWLRTASSRPVVTPAAPASSSASLTSGARSVPMHPSQPLLRRLTRIAASGDIRPMVAFARPLALARNTYQWTADNPKRIRGRAVLVPVEDIAAYEIDPILEVVEEAERHHGLV